ncbi:hypothetical protein EF405_19105 [Cyclobacteriaceae bacterium YHN15]|nr:hypothetical protein EF405_19105 [Cyclobacteriaceae bacterium YHN15]
MHFDEVIKNRSFEVFKHYLGQFYKSGTIEQKEKISNPFILPRKQVTPSFNVFRALDGQFIYNDYATGDTGDCVTLTMKLGNFRTRREAKAHIRYVLLTPQPKKFNPYE